MNRKPEAYILTETYLRFKFEYNQENINKVKRAFKTELTQSFLRNNKNKEVIKFSIEFEKGSLKTKIIVWGTVLYIGIGNYGSFKAGIREIYKDGKAFSLFVKEQMLQSDEIDEDAKMTF